MPQLCLELTSKLESLKQLKAEFDLELSSLPQTGKTEDLALVRNAKTKLEQNLKELREKLPQLDWQDFYQTVFGLECDLSGIKIPEKREGFDRLIIMAQGLTAEQLWLKTKEVCGEVGRIFSSELDSTISERTTEAAYAFWVRDNQEANVELKNISVEQIEQQNLTTETLEERLLHGLKYFKETGQQLDVDCRTMCCSSFGLLGYPLTVGYTMGKVRIMEHVDRVQISLVCAREVIT
ncbi:MAG: hypothetical protein WCW02_01805 [Candidatus Buchananbacteria bacterium]